MGVFFCISKQMASNADLIEKWEIIQTKTFTNWVNSHLVKRGKKIESVKTDLSDGVMLASIGSEEICDQNLKLTLGLVWTLILRFAIVGLSEEGLSAKEGLLLWCQRKTEPYDNVDIKDFTFSFQDGLGLCALIHRHRPDLIDYDSLSSENKLDNLDVAKLLGAEDIVNMPKPDERSIMTYVAQLYQVFSSLDKVEVAGRRIGKLADFAQTMFILQHDYEERSRALKSSVTSKSNELENAALGNDYATSRQLISEFREYRRTLKRQWVGEQEELQSLFNVIQAKLKTNRRPAYTPPEGLSVSDIDNDMNALNNAESSRRTALNAQLRAILDALRKAFADKLASLKSALATVGEVGELDQQLETIKSN